MLEYRTCLWTAPEEEECFVMRSKISIFAAFDHCCSRGLILEVCTVFHNGTCYSI